MDKKKEKKRFKNLKSLVYHATRNAQSRKEDVDKRAGARALSTCMSFSVRTETNPKGEGRPPTTPRQHAKSLQKTETRQLGNRAVSGPSTAGATDFSRRSEHRSVSDLLQATRLKTHVRSKTHHFSI